MTSKKLKEMTDDELEAEAEWIVEARGEGYSWKQLAKKYGVSIPTLKKTIFGNRQTKKA